MQSEELESIWHKEWKMRENSVITFSHNVHYTNGWCNLLGKKIQIVQQ